MALDAAKEEGCTFLEAAAPRKGRRRRVMAKMKIMLTARLWVSSNSQKSIKYL
jgi:hypothetical protein